MSNPLPPLPDELPPRAVELLFELTDEHLALYRENVHALLATTGTDPDAAGLAALTEVVKLVWVEHVLPIEEALVASETQVADLGRRLFAALHDRKGCPAGSSCYALDDDALPDADERARQRLGTNR